MKGLDPKFVEIPDYIIGITRELWEDRRIAKVHDCQEPLLKTCDHVRQST